jgi:hypothetical protein
VVLIALFLFWRDEIPGQKVKYSATDVDIVSLLTWRHSFQISDLWGFASSEYQQWALRVLQQVLFLFGRPNTWLLIEAFICFRDKKILCLVLNPVMLRNYEETIFTLGSLT